MRNSALSSNCSGRINAHRPLAAPLLRQPKLPVITKVLPVSHRPLPAPCPRWTTNFPARPLPFPIAAAEDSTTVQETKKKEKQKRTLSSGQRKPRSEPRDKGKESPRPTQQHDTFVPSKEQQHAVDLVLRGKNIFLTGCAGTGKSATLREIRHRLLYGKYGGNGELYNRKVAVVAMTGLAATNVEGVTLHSLLALGTADTFHSFERMTYGQRILEVLSELDTLVLDEAGMMSAEMLQALDAYITLARKGAISKRKGKLTEEQWKALQKAVDRPFGGLQVILSGDVFQLAPIEKTGTSSSPTDSTSSGQYGRGGSMYGGGGNGSSHGGPDPSARPGVARRELKPHERPFLNRGFLFQAPVFEYGGFKLIELTEVFRQDDQGFVDVLNAIRCGTPAESRAAMALLCAACQRPLDESDGIRPTVLFSRNKDAEARNNEEMAKLPDAEVVLTADDTAVADDKPPTSIYAPLVKEGLMTAADFSAWERRVEEEDKSRADAISKLQPVSLAARATELGEEWERAVHQHLIDTGNRSGGLFKECQAPSPLVLKEGAQVMLVRNLDLDSQLVNGSRGVVVDFVKVDCNHPVAEETFAIARAMGLHVEADLTRWFSRNPRLPVVQFVKVDKVVPPVVFTTTLPGYGKCVRIQVPLKLAWAITVHKSQGMTLDKAEINVTQFWGHGMMYTALSRMRNKQGLQVKGYSERTMDPRVMEWWEALRAGRRYVNPHAEPGGPWGSPPWCWQDPEQRVLFKGQSPQARRWLRDQRRGVEGGGGGRGRGGSGARRGGGQAPAAAAAEDAGVTSDGA